MTSPIGLFGLGLIGSSLAARLIAAQHTVIGFDPDPACREALTQNGGHASEATEVWSAKIVLAAVFDTDQLASLIEAAPIGDTTLISFSTCDPNRMPELAEAAMAKGITLIEAPLSGTSKDLANGNAVFLIGGEADQINDLAWLWQALGRAFHHVGAVGNGNRAKLAVNLVLGLNRAALAEGLVYAQSVGLDPKSFLPLLQDTAARSDVMASKGPKMVERDFEPLGRITQSAKDFGLITALAQDAGQHLPFATTYLEMMNLSVETGNGALDNAAVLLAIEMSKDGKA